MTSRRQFLGTAAAGGLGLLAGCSVLGGDGGTGYPDAIPSPDAFSGSSLYHAARYDLAAVRQKDLAHEECTDGVVGCTMLANGLIADDSFVLSADDVDAVAVGGAHEIFAYERSMASPTGMYLFKIYEYSADSSTVQSALETQFTPESSIGGFQFYRGTGDGMAGNSVLADDGNRMVVGLDGAPTVVVERITGEHESFETAYPDVGATRTRLGNTDLELVTFRGSVEGAEAAWHERSKAVGKGVEVTNSNATYRLVHLFETADELATITDDDVRSSAETRLLPGSSDSWISVDVSIERNGRALVLSGTADRHVGLI